METHATFYVKGTEPWCFYSKSETFFFFFWWWNCRNRWRCEINCTVRPHCTLSFSHLFCTVISENQGLDKSNLIKISVPVHLIFFSVHLNFFSVCHLNFFQVYGINLKKNPDDKLKKIQVYWKKIQVCRTWNFSKVWIKLSSEGVHTNNQANKK